MPKQQVIEQLQAARAALLTAIDGLSDDVMLRPGVVGMWSIKDILAHLSAWESELVTALAQLDNSASIPGIVRIDDIDEWNDEQYRVNVRRSMEAVRTDFLGVHKHLLIAIGELNDNLLDNPRKFGWMEGEPLSYLIAENPSAKQPARWCNGSTSDSESLGRGSNPRRANNLSQ